MSETRGALPVLVLCVGLPRSGKSTWARASGLPVVSPDAIRLALHGEAFLPRAEPVVWVIAKLMVAALFEAGHPTVVVDACNTTQARRDAWRDPRWETDFQEFPADAEECWKRALSGDRVDLLDSIDRMASRLEPVTDAERTSP